MSAKEQALYSISEVFGQSATMDQILGLVVIGVAVIAWMVYGYLHHAKRAHRHPSDGFH